MGTPKKTSKKLQSQLRPRTTRSSKARLLSDPMENTAMLTEQLRSLGLYAANTIGDGNCLFRALSDQLYGSPSRHAQLRRDICDWIARHKSRYEPFVEDDRGIDVHLRCMRENATYGGHMELSAFAHLTQRNVKVIQPGLVYVIEWAAGGGPSSPTVPTVPNLGTSASSSSLSSLSSLAPSASPSPAPPASGSHRVDAIDVDAAGDDGYQLPEEGTIYVAYHDWEHFSSIRNLKGPHTGLPCVHETPPYPSPSTPDLPNPKQSKADAKERKRMEREAKQERKNKVVEEKPASEEKRSVLPKVRLKLSSASPTKPVEPSLPPSASKLGAAAEEGARTLRSSRTSGAGSSASGSGRVQRSPKRSFDESSGSAGSESESVAKRTRSAYAYSSRTASSSRRGDDDDADARRDDGEEDEEVDVDGDGDGDVEMDSGSDDEDDLDEDDDEAEEGGAEESRSSGTSGTSLSLSLSPPALSSSSSLSSLSSMSPSPPPEPVPVVPIKPLTRRERKKLGLPKTRATAPAATKGSAGKIIIPGGRFEGTGEWQRNGTGRVDVRGFRELKI
ncbi:OTU domain-containing protein [Favolaschia claudopus]|uniref:OTU domain-containing protein n=1 Tax=Favolaschia claudopus TaxID=2862362 RepID=A0AAW0C913_9AGAR